MTRLARLLHLEQLLLLAFEHLVDRHTGPARHHLGHVVGGHGLLNHGAIALAGLDRGQPLLKVRNPAIGQFAGALEFAAALRVGEFDTVLVELALQLLGVRQLAFSALQRDVEVGRAFFQVRKVDLQRLQAAPGARIAFLLQRFLLDLQPNDLAIDGYRALSGLESTCIFSRAAASSTRSMALSGRKRSVM